MEPVDGNKPVVAESGLGILRDPAVLLEVVGSASNSTSPSEALSLLPETVDRNVSSV